MKMKEDPKGSGTFVMNLPAGKKLVIKAGKNKIEISTEGINLIGTVVVKPG